MTTTMQIPNVDVKYTNIRIDHRNRKALVDVQTRKHGNKRWSKVTTLECTITQAVIDWLFNRYTHNDITTTGFQSYLRKQGISFQPGILNTMSFESYNLSEDYASNPFKIIQYTNGLNTFTLVNAKPLIKLDNGKYQKPTYRNAEGKLRVSYYSKNAYRRLAIQC